MIFTRTYINSRQTRIYLNRVKFIYKHFFFNYIGSKQLKTKTIHAHPQELEYIDKWVRLVATAYEIPVNLKLIL